MKTQIVDIDWRQCPAISLQTLGDIHFRATGRIHQHAALHSQHVDGKIMHSVAFKLLDAWGDAEPFQTVQLEAQLAGGGTFNGELASGQHFPGVEMGTNTFKLPNVLEPRPLKKVGD